MSLYIITELNCLIKCERSFWYLSSNYTNNSFYFCTAVHTLLNSIRDCLVNKIHAFNIFKLFTLFSNKKRSKGFSNLTPLTFTILWKYLFDLFYYLNFLFFHPVLLIVFFVFYLNHLYEISSLIHQWLKKEVGQV